MGALLFDLTCIIRLCHLYECGSMLVPSELHIMLRRNIAGIGALHFFDLTCIVHLFMFMWVDASAI